MRFTPCDLYNMFEKNHAFVSSVDTVHKHVKSLAASARIAGKYCKLYFLMFGAHYKGGNMHL